MKMIAPTCEKNRCALRDARTRVDEQADDLTRVTKEEVAHVEHERARVDKAAA